MAVLHSVLYQITAQVEGSRTRTSWTDYMTLNFIQQDRIMQSLFGQGQGPDLTQH